MKRAAIVTGATGGLGVAVCHELAERDYHVALLARDAAGVAAIATQLPEAAGFAVDVRDMSATAAIVDTVRERFGRLDALVTCAGIGRASATGLLPRPVA